MSSRHDGALRVALTSAIDSGSPIGRERADLFTARLYRRRESMGTFT